MKFLFILQHQSWILSFNVSWDSVAIIFRCRCQPKSSFVEIRSVSVCFLKTLKGSNVNSRILAFPCDNLQGIWRTTPGPNWGRNRTTWVLFQIPVLPRSTKRREGNAAMLQVERSARVLGRWHKDAGSQDEHCFPKLTAPWSQTQPLWKAWPFPHAASCPRSSHGNCRGD